VSGGFPQGVGVILNKPKDLGHLIAKFIPLPFQAELSEIAIYLRKPPFLVPFNPPIFAFLPSKNVQTGAS
jgi:hypothetical protein